MTLISAIRCDNGAAVLHADSQETVTLPDGREYRVRVTKVQPREANNYEVVIGGAGASGPLIDRFSRDVITAVSTWPHGLNDLEVERRLREALESFHLTYLFATTYQSSDFEFIICTKDKGAEGCGLWIIRDTDVSAIERYDMIGWEEALYRREMEWLCRGTPWITQAILLGIRLFTLAKETSNYVGGPTKVIAVNDEMKLLPENVVQELERRSDLANTALARVVLACPDASINEAEFKALLYVFEDQMLQLRSQFTGRADVGTRVSFIAPEDLQLQLKQFDDQNSTKMLEQVRQNDWQFYCGLLDKFGLNSSALLDEVVQ